MTITGLVLAAGSSTRLGQPKQLLPFRGRTLVEVLADSGARAGRPPGCGSATSCSHGPTVSPSTPRR